MPTRASKLGRKKRHDRKPGLYRYRLENNENIDDICIVGAMFPWLETRGFCHALPHRKWRGVQRQLAALHSDGFFTHELPQIGSDVGLQNKLIATDKCKAFLEARGLLPEPLVYDPEAKRHNKGGYRIHTHHTNMHIYFLASLWGGFGKNLATRRQLIGDRALDIPYTFVYKGAERKGVLRPDDFIRIKRDIVKEYYFYEAQCASPRGTSDLGRSSGKQKALAYYNIIKTQQYHKNEMGINKVRVLFTFLTEEKMHNFLDMVKELEPDYKGIGKLLYCQVVTWNGKFDPLYNSDWYRAGYPPVRLDVGEEMLD